MIHCITGRYGGARPYQSAVIQHVGRCTLTDPRLTWVTAPAEDLADHVLAGGVEPATRRLRPTMARWGIGTCDLNPAEGAVWQPAFKQLISVPSWDVRQRQHGVLGRFADDAVVMCQTKQQAEVALARLASLLADLGLEPKAGKTRIVHLAEAEEGFDFLGFHHRLVRGWTPGRRI